MPGAQFILIESAPYLFNQLQHATGAFQGLREKNINIVRAVSNRAPGKSEVLSSLEKHKGSYHMGLQLCNRNTKCLSSFNLFPIGLSTRSDFPKQSQENLSSLNRNHMRLFLISKTKQSEKNNFVCSNAWETISYTPRTAWVSLDQEE